VNARPTATPPPLDEVEPTMIVPTRSWWSLGLSEVWGSGELVAFLTWRDVIVRYKQAVFGIAWAVVQPLATMIIFTIIFGRIARLPSEGVPYPVFAYAALLPWQLFASSVQRAGVSMVGNAPLITKIYFPRLAIPLAAVGAGLVDFVVSFLVFVGLLVAYGIGFRWSDVMLPLLVVYVVAATLGFGLWLSALNVLFRDVQSVIPLLVQVLMYLSPVVYPASMVPPAWQPIYWLNPMAGVIQAFRWALLGTPPPPPGLFALSVGVTVVLLGSGLIFFRRTERMFADLV
jgi:lipopolysaccharide transport system permease protein